MYHPVFDPYHTILRILEILVYGNGDGYTKNQIRIMDFYLSFPEFVKDIKTTRSLMYKKKSVSPETNKYYTPDERKAVFIQMEEIHEAALRVLVTSGIVGSEEGRYFVITDELTGSLEDLVQQRIQETKEVLDVLVELADQTPPIGEGSLKDRTGLLEHRYDVG
jgi:hypothetical protein